MADNENLCAAAEPLGPNTQRLAVRAGAFLVSYHRWYGTKGGSRPIIVDSAARASPSQRNAILPAARALRVAFNLKSAQFLQKTKRAKRDLPTWRLRAAPISTRPPPKIARGNAYERPATPPKRPCCWKRDGGCLGQPFIRDLVRCRRDPLFNAARPPRTSITRTRKTHASMGCSSASPAYVETMRGERRRRRDDHGLPRRRPRRPIVSAGHGDVLLTCFVVRGRRDRRRAGRPWWPRHRRDAPELVERTSSR